MAPPLKLPEVTISNGGMSYEGKGSKRVDKGCRWIVTSLAINLCITAILVGLTLVYVNKELDSVKDELKSTQTRLAWLEGASSNPDASWVPPHSGQQRARRDQSAEEIQANRPGRLSERFLSFVGDNGRRGSCSCQDGRDGREGREGKSGPPGAPGPQGAKGEKGDMGLDETSVIGPRRHRRDADDADLLADALPAHRMDTTFRPEKRSGDTYVRWGRTTCPNSPDTELVYAGNAAGSHYAHKGGSTDFWCMPAAPDWASTYSDTANSHSYLYGVEYAVPWDPFSHENTDVVNQRDVPCAVCRLLRRSSRLVLPATLGCPNGNWTEEYRGFLMSGRHQDEQRSSAICVDQAPEAVPGSQAAVNGARLYIMEGQCGSLLCPPYVSLREITCTVCSI